MQENFKKNHFKGLPSGQGSYGPKSALAKPETVAPDITKPNPA
jgi:hypothetical protein